MPRAPKPWPRDSLKRVLEAADDRARELLAQASKYEGLGQPTVAKETMNEHYKPLRKAIDEVKGRFL